MSIIFNDVDTDSDEDFCFTYVHDNPTIDKNWLLLDSQATKHVFANKKLLTNVCIIEDGICIYWHVGSRVATQVERVKGTEDEVWLDEGGISNILSLKSIHQHHCVSYNNWAFGNCFMVHKPNDQLVLFKESSNGLYYHDFKNRAYGNKKKLTYKT